MITPWSLNIWHIWKEVKVSQSKDSRQATPTQQLTGWLLSRVKSNINNLREQHPRAKSAIFVFAVEHFAQCPQMGRNVKANGGGQRITKSVNWRLIVCILTQQRHFAFESWVLQYFNTYWPISVSSVWTFHQVLLCRTLRWLRTRPYVNSWQRLHDCLKI